MNNHYIFTKRLNGVEPFKFIIKKPTITEVIAGILANQICVDYSNGLFLMLDMSVRQFPHFCFKQGVVRLYFLIKFKVLFIYWVDFYISPLSF